MSFEEIYQTYVDAVYGFLMFRLQNQHLVEDILQETFLAVYQSMNKADEIISIKAWILSIANNKMVDHLRKGHNKEQTLITELVLVDTADEPANNLFFNEALSQLEDAERTIIYGLYAEKLSYKELALILNIPEGTAKSKAYYARKKLHCWFREGSK